MRYRILLFCACFLHCRIHAQDFIISGKITDKNDPLPFATVMVKGTSNGVSSNINGFYTLKLPAGSYEIIFQYIGYSSHQEKIILHKNEKRDIQLTPEGMSLKEVTIRAGEDPSYLIMRRAIGRRKYYHNQVTSYTCDAYIKGLQKITGTPKNLKSIIKVAGGDLSDTSELKGIVYLSESQSRYYFQRPNEKEVMYSSRVSGNNQSFSFNQLTDMKVNFYSNLLDLGNLSNKPFISPLHDNAFLFYRYFLIGKISGENKTVYKIKVVPKRKSEPCFRGIIYIQDSTWRLTNIDLSVTKDSKINFVDTLTIKQVHSPVAGDSVWMPVNLNLAFVFQFLGFKGHGYFNAHIRDYQLNTLFPKKFFNNEILEVEEGANQKDSLYWARNRAVPLTTEEVTDYHQKDSIQLIQENSWYKDSMEKKDNRYGLSNFLTGYTFTKNRKNLLITLPGIITNGVQYNTVEGVNLSYKIVVQKTFSDKSKLNVTARSRYGFSNKLWGGEAGFNYEFNPLTFSGFGFSIKSMARQFNPMEPIPPWVNSVYTLFLNENYMKLFRESAALVNYHTEIVNGAYFGAHIKFAQRDPLTNTSKLLIVDDKNKSFTSNLPVNGIAPDGISSSSAFTAGFNFTIRFRQRYYRLPGQKIVSGSKYPTLSIGWLQAIPVLNRGADFSEATAALYDQLELGLIGMLEYRLSGGGFPWAKKLYFADFRHFQGNQTIVQTPQLTAFRLLPYYTYSADRWFSEVHAEHHFKGLIINHLPLLKKLKVQEVAGVHALSNNRLKYYYELNFGLEKIFNFLRVDYVVGYSSEGKIRHGFTAGFNLSF